MKFRIGAMAVGAAVACVVYAAEPSGGDATTNQYRNLFRDYLGKSDTEITARVDGAWQQIVAGDPDSQRLFYPVAGDMAYVPDVANNDVRTEGLSYLMMIAVQLNHQKEFNQVWKFAKHYMCYDAGPFRGYFAWHTAFDGRRLSPGPAPDGEEWFTMALFFASHRWGDGEGIFNYGAEAQNLLRAMLHAGEEPGRQGVGSMFDRESKEIKFVPEGPRSNFTDASYHLPAFYELFIPKRDSCPISRTSTAGHFARVGQGRTIFVTMPGAHSPIRRWITRGGKQIPGRSSSRIASCGFSRSGAITSPIASRSMGLRYPKT